MYDCTYIHTINYICMYVCTYFICQINNTKEGGSAFR